MTMTQAEKLALRLSQFPNRLVSVLAFVDASGALVFWVIDEDKKIEGANGRQPDALKDAASNEAAAKT